MEKPICGGINKLDNKCCDSRGEKCIYYQETIDKTTKNVIKKCNLILKN